MQIRHNRSVSIELILLLLYTKLKLIERSRWYKKIEARKLDRIRRSKAKVNICQIMDCGLLHNIFTASQLETIVRHNHKRWAAAWMMPRFNCLFKSVKLLIKKHRKWLNRVIHANVRVKVVFHIFGGCLRCQSRYKEVNCWILEIVAIIAIGKCHLFGFINLRWVATSVSQIFLGSLVVNITSSFSKMSR